MAQLDDIVGAVMQKLKDDGLDDDTIVVFTTDNGTGISPGPTAVRRRLRAAKAPCSKGDSASRASSAGPARCPREGRERDHLRPRLVSDPGRRRRQPAHRGGAQAGKQVNVANTRFTSTATIRWT